MKVRWSKRALDDLDAIGEFIAEDDPGAAAAWVGRLFRRAEDAADQPSAGRVVPEVGDPSIRELIEKNYRIVYQVRAEDVLIVTVLEGHMRLRLP